MNKVVPGRIFVTLLILCLSGVGTVAAAFTDKSSNEGLSAPAKKSFGDATRVDINNDGLPDLINIQHTRTMNVHSNQGDGQAKFENVSAQSVIEAVDLEQSDLIDTSGLSQIVFDFSSTANGIDENVFQFPVGDESSLSFDNIVDIPC